MGQRGAGDRRRQRRLREVPAGRVQIGGQAREDEHLLDANVRKKRS